MADLARLRLANAERWADVRLQRSFTSVAKSLVEAKPRYLTVSQRTGVPWWFIAVVHEREASQSWKGSLAQGDPWDQVSTHVPAGRGPFKSWEDAAVDALLNCSPFAGHNKDWTIGGSLTMMEQYNGLGYANRGVPSPYVWAGTDQYRSGKFIRDGVYDPSVIDRQPGCAGLLLSMITLDASIRFGTPTPEPVSKPAPAAPPPPSITHPAPGSIGAFIARIFNAIFRRTS
jgi:lysozyme family protein